MLLVIMALCVKDENTQKRDELKVRHGGFGCHTDMALVLVGEEHRGQVSILQCHAAWVPIQLSVAARLHMPSGDPASSSCPCVISPSECVWELVLLLTNRT